MTKLYAIYGMIVLLTFGYASQQGYTFGSLFSGGQPEKHSGATGHSHSYHK